MGLFGFSFVLHVFLLGFLQTGVFGINLSLCLNNLLNRYINLIPIFSFIVFILLKFYLSYNVIFLDDKDIIVTASLDNANFVITGDVFKLIFENLGGAAVFGVGARIATGLLAKHPMPVFPKIGVIGGTGVGYTILYRMSMESMGSSISNSSASVSVSPVHIKLETVSNTTFDGNAVNSLVNNLGLNNKSQLSQFSFTESSNLNKIYLNSQNNQTNSQIISALDQQNPNWRDSFIHSPLELELEKNLTPHIISVLSDNLLLHFIILYLLIMLLIIISCKFIIKDNIEFTKIQNHPLGGWVKYIINKFISIWKVSSNFWIYFILFNVLVFNSASIYSIYSLLILLK